MRAKGLKIRARCSYKIIQHWIIWRLSRRKTSVREICEATKRKNSALLITLNEHAACSTPSCETFFKLNRCPWNSWLFRNAALRFINVPRLSGLLSIQNRRDGWLRGDGSISTMNNFTLISWLNQITSKKWALCDVESEIVWKHADSRL